MALLRISQCPVLVILLAFSKQTKCIFTWHQKKNFLKRKMWLHAIYLGSKVKCQHTIYFDIDLKLRYIFHMILKYYHHSSWKYKQKCLVYGNIGSKNNHFHNSSMRKYLRPCSWQLNVLVLLSFEAEDILEQTRFF